MTIEKWLETWDPYNDMTVWDFVWSIWNNYLIFTMRKILMLDNYKAKRIEKEKREKSKPVTGSVGFKLKTTTQNSNIKYKSNRSVNYAIKSPSMYVYKTKISNWFVSVWNSEQWSLNRKWSVRLFLLYSLSKLSSHLNMQYMRCCRLSFSI